MEVGDTAAEEDALDELQEEAELLLLQAEDEICLPAASCSSAAALSCRQLIINLSSNRGSR